ATIHHGFCFPVWAGHGSGIQVVASNYNGGFHLAFPYKSIKFQSGFFPFALSKPANPGRQTLESDFFTSHVNPAMQSYVIGKQAKNGIIRNTNIFRITAQGNPAKRSFTFAEKR